MSLWRITDVVLGLLDCRIEVALLYALRWCGWYLPRLIAVVGWVVRWYLLSLSYPGACYGSSGWHRLTLRKWKSMLALWHIDCHGDSMEA